jgi:hypothetical protein
MHSLILSYAAEIYLTTTILNSTSSYCYVILPKKDRLRQDDRFAINYGTLHRDSPVGIWWRHIELDRMNHSVWTVQTDVAAGDRTAQVTARHDTYCLVLSGQRRVLRSLTILVCHESRWTGNMADFDNECFNELLFGSNVIINDINLL